MPLISSTSSGGRDGSPLTALCPSSSFFLVVRPHHQLIGTEKKKKRDSHRRDRILRFFLRPEIVQFSPHFGAMSILNYTVNQEKRGKKSIGEFKKIQWRRAPQLQISVLCRGRKCPDFNRTLLIHFSSSTCSLCVSGPHNHNNLSGDTFAKEAPQNLLGTKEYSKNISSGKEILLKFGNKLLRTFFWCLL